MVIRSKHVLVSALGVALAAGVPMGGTARAQESVQAPTKEERFGATFRYVGGQRERTNLETAIELSVDELVWVIQGIARRRLKETNPIAATTTISFANGKIAVHRPGLKTIAAPADGSAVKWTNDFGDKANVRFRWRGEKLVQSIWNGQGGSEVIYSLNADGTRLRISVRVYSDRLPVPVRYRLTYARK